MSAVSAATASSAAAAAVSQVLLKRIAPSQFIDHARRILDDPQNPFYDELDVETLRVLGFGFEDVEVYLTQKGEWISGIYLFFPRNSLSMQRILRESQLLPHPLAPDATQYKFTSAEDIQLLLIYFQLFHLPWARNEIDDVLATLAFQADLEAIHRQDEEIIKKNTRRLEIELRDLMDAAKATRNQIEVIKSQILARSEEEKHTLRSQFRPIGEECIIIAGERFSPWGDEEETNAHLQRLTLHDQIHADQVKRRTQSDEGPGSPPK